MSPPVSATRGSTPIVQKTRPRTSRRVRLFAVVLGLAVGLAGTEGILRLFSSSLQLDAFAGWENNRDARVFRASPEMGLEPIPGISGYNEYGVLDYGYTLTRVENLLRILVLGDSVSHRRFWVETMERGLRVVLGPGKFVEAWNAGVEGYYTPQEEAFLRTKGLGLRADLVLLQFHLNDFLPLPVLYRDHDGNTAFLPFAGEFGQINPTLFQWSFLYRYWVLRVQPTREDRLERNRALVERSLKNIAQMCQDNGLDFLMVIFPLFKPEEDYDPKEKQWHEWILEIVQREGYAALDLHDVLPGGAERNALRESSEDTWHPNRRGHRLAGQAVTNFILKNPKVRKLRKKATWLEKGKSQDLPGPEKANSFVPLEMGQEAEQAPQ